MQATLVMESHDITPGTRGFHFSDAWNRLYQVGEYFVDLMYQPGEGGGKLHGQVLRKDGEHEAYQGSAQLGDKVPLSADGQFDLGIEHSGQADLTLALNNKVVEVNGLTFLRATMF